MRARMRTAAVAAIAATVIISGSVPASADPISAPDITFSPADHAIVRGTVTVTAGNVADDVVRIALTNQVTGQEITAATAAPWELSWDTVAHPRSISLIVTDRAGHHWRFDPTWTSDNLAPTIHDLTYYSAGKVPGRVHGLTQLNAPLSDATGVNHVQWLLDGTLISQSQSTSSATFTGDLLTWNFGTAEGTHQLEVRAWDRAGNESARTFPIAVDNTGPTIVSASPANGALLRGSRISGTIKATDPSGVTIAVLNHYDAPKFAASIPAGTDGKHTITWWVADGVGNSRYLTRTVTVDNTRPTLKITSGPKDKAKVKGTVTLKASASDHNGVNRVELLVNGKVVAKDTTAGYSFSINTTKYGKTLKVQLRAYDKAGNSLTTSTRTWHR
jgi:archaellum component FlaF (FlaF/FlaG flagellin family)